MNQIMQYVKHIIPASHLKEGYDFDIVSFLIFDPDELEFQTFDQYYQTSSLDIIKDGEWGQTPKEILLHHLQKQGIQENRIQETDFYPSEKLVFYWMQEDINVNLALSLGFGIVRMKRGELKNRYLLYYTHTIGWDDEEEEQIFSEIVMLKAYIQLLNRETFRDRTLERILEEDPHHILFSLVCNKSLYMEQLLEIYEQ